MTAPRDLNEDFDYAANCDVFYDAIHALAQNEMLNQYSPGILADALLCLNVSKNVSADELVPRVSELLLSNEYHSQAKIATFASFVLYNYAQSTGKTLYDAYRDFLMFGIFDTLYYHYMGMHTQSVSYAVKSITNMIQLRYAIRDTHNLPCIVDERLVSMMPNLPAAEHNLQYVFSNRAQEASSKRYMSLEIACLAIIIPLVEKANVDGILTQIGDIAAERETRMTRIFDAFAKAHHNDGISIHDWMWNASVTGLMPLIEQAQKDNDIDAIENALYSELSARGA